MGVGDGVGDGSAGRRPAGGERGEERIGSLPSAPPCPFCDGSETELMSAFGSHASVATYWCRACRSPFEMLKWK